MSKRTGPTNINTRKLVLELKRLAKKEEAAVWARLAEEIETPTRRRREVNISRIDMHAKDNETILVPGKVLSAGSLSKKLTVAAFKFSGKAKEKISKSGNALSIEELMKKNPSGKGVRILG